MDAAGVAAIDVVLAYHERTKHHFHRFAASPGYMDWATQPDPFRRYEGAPIVRLPLPPSGRRLPYGETYASGHVTPAPLSIESLSLFFRYALSLTAWKQFQGTRWALRANPSSGNLHPTEGYALLPALAGIHDRPGVHHYAPRDHGLERRAGLDAATWSRLTAGLPEQAFFVGLTSIHWREAWKYGERAFRYCQHDVGHALAALRIAAATLGWRLVLCTGVGDAEVSTLLGIDREADYGQAEREHPDLLGIVIPATRMDAVPVGFEPPPEVVRSVEAADWHGRANVLSPTHGMDWPIIDEVARATFGVMASPTIQPLQGFPSGGELFDAVGRPGSSTAEHVILGRRSAVAMDGVTPLAAAAFFRMMGRLVPTRDGRSMPWDLVPWTPRIHLAVFVHRVQGLPPGLYALARDPGQVEALRIAMRADFEWRRPPDSPPGLPLYLLTEGDCRQLATRVSCGQDIAGDGAFSLGMITRLADGLARHGPGFYRRLFWEAGMVGQVLYLEAEDAGVRGTGIGCYFDDAVHDVFGLTSRDWQSFYHFTVGGPVEDGRLTTLPAYGSEA